MATTMIVNCEGKLTLDLPFIYVNPPLVHAGDESPLSALREIVAQTVRG